MNKIRAHGQTQYVHIAMTTLDSLLFTVSVGSICHELYSRGCQIRLASTSFQVILDRQTLQRSI
jgi:hypothetical protein